MIPFSRFTRRLALSASLAAFAVLSLPAHAASYVWLEKTDAGVQARLGQLLPDGTNEATPALAEPRALLADGKTLAVAAANDGYRIDLPADAVGKDVRFTAKTVGSDDVLTIFEAKEGRAEIKAVNDLELVPTAPGATSFRLMWKGNPVAATQVNVETSAGWRRTVKAGSDGSIALASPAYPSLFPSRYVLEVTAKINGKVTLDGKTYDEVRHTATLSFDVK